MNIKEIKISKDGTHHIFNGEPIYEKRFQTVLKFHQPGFAPVNDESGAYHISMKGQPAYENRFIKTFGFYFDKAAVITNTGWGHVNTKGELIYEEKYAWVGNYQENVCTIRDQNGNYFHINDVGERIYNENMLYAGDFKDDIAVIRKKTGLCTHVYINGDYIHNQYFLDLDIYHKKLARARDDEGWFHIDLNGHKMYNQRFQIVEPFYNGFAFVETIDGIKQIINEKGEKVHSILEKSSDETQNAKERKQDNFFELFDEISSSLVSFWESQTISAGVKLGIFENINQKGIFLEELADKIEIEYETLLKIIRGLSALDLLKVKENRVFITRKGEFLQNDNEFSLATAAIMWSEEHYETWKKISNSLKSGKEEFSSLFNKPYFEWLEVSDKKAELYQKAISTYAKKDYYRVPKIQDFSKHKIVLDVGGGSGHLLRYLLEMHPNLKGMLLESKKTIEIAKYEVLKDFTNRCEFITGNFFEKIPKGADAIFLCRILHDWDDENASKILSNCYEVLESNDKLYVVELILHEDLNDPLGALLNLNMLTITGGKERTKTEFRQLLERSCFKIEHIKEINNSNSLIIATKE